MRSPETLRNETVSGTRARKHVTLCKNFIKRLLWLVSSVAGTLPRDEWMSVKNLHRSPLLILLACCWAAGCGSGTNGIAGYGVVKPNVLYRGAQPTAEGFRYLKAAGIRTVLDLRYGPRDEEKSLVEQLGMNYVNIPCYASEPSDEAMARFHSIALSPEQQPVFVHCRQGKDRTGTAVAVYRMVVEGWGAEQAIAELREHEGLNALFLPQIRQYLRQLDAERIRVRTQDGSAAGMAVTARTPRSGT